MSTITYNRALDHVVLAMDELKKGNHVLAARLFAKSASQADFQKAIHILEASNRAAYAAMEAKKVEAKKLAAAAKPAAKPVAAAARIQASEDEAEPAEDFPMEDADASPVEGEDDPVKEVEDEEEPQEPPAMAMAKVLSSMVKRPAKA